MRSGLKFSELRSDQKVGSLVELLLHKCRKWHHDAVQIRLANLKNQNEDSPVKHATVHYFLLKQLKQRIPPACLATRENLKTISLYILLGLLAEGCSG